MSSPFGRFYNIPDISDPIGAYPVQGDWSHWVTTEGYPVPPLPAVAGTGPAPDDRGAFDKLLGRGGERYQLWPERAARDVVTAMGTPGEALAGRFDSMDPGTGHVSDEAIKRATDLAGAVTLGSGFAAPAEVAEKGLGAGVIKRYDKIFEPKKGEHVGPERVERAAVRDPADGRVGAGPNHGMATEDLFGPNENMWPPEGYLDEGYITNRGRFVDRVEAKQMADAMPEYNDPGVPWLNEKGAFSEDFDPGTLYSGVNKTAGMVDLMSHIDNIKSKIKSQLHEGPLQEEKFWGSGLAEMAASKGWITPLDAAILSKSKGWINKFNEPVKPVKPSPELDYSYHSHDDDVNPDITDYTWSDEYDADKTYNTHPVPQIVKWLKENTNNFDPDTKYPGSTIRQIAKESGYDVFGPDHPEYPGGETWWHRPETTLPVDPTSVAGRAEAMGASPDVYYHATTHPGVIDRWRDPEGELGIHMGTPAQAANRIRYSSGKGQVYPVRPLARNPVRLDDLGSWHPHKIAGNLLENQDRLADLSPETSARLLEKLKKIHEDRGNKQSLRAALEEAGYDSYVYKNTYESNVPEDAFAIAPAAQKIKGVAHPGNKEGFNVYTGSGSFYGNFPTREVALDQLSKNQSYTHEVPIKDITNRFADSLAVFGPEQMRSPWANFDPARKGEVGLLLAGGSKTAGSTPELLRQLREKKAREVTLRDVEKNMAARPEYDPAKDEFRAALTGAGPRNPVREANRKFTSVRKTMDADAAVKFRDKTYTAAGGKEKAHADILARIKRVTGLTDEDLDKELDENSFGWVRRSDGKWLEQGSK